MSHNSTTMNGAAQRKTLASQLDRLDGIINAMADGLPKTIADVLREAVTVAVQETIQTVITELLSQPERLRQLAGLNAPAPAPVPAPSEPVVPPQNQTSPASATSKLRRVWTWVCSKVPDVRQGWRDAGRKVWQHRYLVGVSLAIGAMVGCTGYVAGPVLSSLALGLCGAAMSAGAFLASPFVRLWRNWQPQTN